VLAPRSIEAQNFGVAIGSEAFLSVDSLWRGELAPDFLQQVFAVIASKSFLMPGAAIPSMRRRKAMFFPTPDGPN